MRERIIAVKRRLVNNKKNNFRHKLYFSTEELGCLQYSIESLKYPKKQVKDKPKFQT